MPTAAARHPVAGLRRSVARDRHLADWRRRTDPDGVGFRLSVEEAIQVGKAIFVPMLRRLAERVYGFKTLIEEGSGRILGATLVGPGADEVINVFALAVRHGLTADDLKATMFAYPTGASDVGYMV